MVMITVLSSLIVISTLSSRRAKAQNDVYLHSLEMLRQLHASEVNTLIRISDERDVQVKHDLVERQKNHQKDMDVMWNTLSGRDAVILSVLPAIVRMAVLDNDTPACELACRWLYCVTSLGLWVPTNGESKAVAKGMRLSALNPTQTEKMIKALTPTKEALLGA
jgi:hypothetical protein